MGGHNSISKAKLTSVQLLGLAIFGTQLFFGTAGTDDLWQAWSSKASSSKEQENDKSPERAKYVWLQRNWTVQEEQRKAQLCNIKAGNCIVQNWNKNESLTADHRGQNLDMAEL